ncbi:hypothetical protein IIA15_07820 [candidate division TA06 bacterium]|nr:hypothetical protein [candidate division TA06 bacterium]
MKPKSGGFEVRKNLNAILSVVFLFGLLLSGNQAIAKKGSVGGNVVVEGDTIHDDYFTGGGSVTVRTPVMGDLFVTGGEITLEGPVGGDLFACGGKIKIEESVDGDILAFGGSIHSTGDVKEDARFFCGEVFIGGTIGRNVAVFGGRVEVGEGGEVGRDLKVQCGEVEIAGTIKRNLKGSADKVTLSGTIEGDVDIKADEILLMPSARILGNFNYTSPEEAEVQEGAFIQGEMSHSLPKKTKKVKGGMGFFPILFKILSLGALILIGIFLILLSPRHVSRASNNIRRTPWKSLGLGLLLLIVMPAVVGILAVTIIGIPLALLLLFAYLVFLYFGKLFTGLFIGQFILKGFGKEEKGRLIGALILGLVILAILTSIPYVGKLFGVLALLFGLGAYFTERLQLYREAKEKGMV